MADTTLDIIAMGDAIVDVIASAEPEFLTRHNLPIGSMQLLTPDRQVVTGQKLRLGRRDHVDDGVAHGDDVERRVGHRRCC